MECRECQDRVVAYLQKELGDLEEKQFKEHLKSCENCQEILKQTEELFSVVDQNKEIEPPATLKARFLDDLNKEKSRLNAPVSKQVFPGTIFYRVAASLALLVVGFSAGMFLNQKETNVSELADLKSEVQSMKQMVMMSMLRDESASERIQAVSYVEDFNQPSQEVIQTLFNTLNKDESPNVRLAAVRALEKFSYDESVRLMLIKSFEFQTDPVVQITLINLMVELEEKRAAMKLQQLIDDTETEKIVRDQAQIGIQILI